ncbi:ribonuclease H-like domain-containing protein, partial [Tanacetum coccineum]
SFHAAFFTLKFNANGSLGRYKACVVGNGRSQQHGIDCDETFSVVVKPATIRTKKSLYGLKEDLQHRFRVDDIMLTTSSSSLMKRIISSLHSEFAKTDLGPLNYFLGILASVLTAHLLTFVCLRANMSQKFLSGPVWLTATRLRVVLLLSPKLEQMAIVLRTYLLQSCRCPATRHSSLAIVFFSAHVFSRSNVEAEYRSVANVFALSPRLSEVHLP